MSAETITPLSRLKGTTANSTSVETLFIASSPETVAISSSIAREVARFGGSLAGIVPEAAREEAEAWLCPAGRK